MYVLSFLWVWSVLVVSGGGQDLEKYGPFKIPLIESRLCVISVNSDKDFQLDLVQEHPKRTISIFLVMTKYSNESQIVATGVGDNIAIVSRDKIDLNVSQRHFFSLFRKDNVLAMYRAGQIKPILVYEYKGLEKLDFGNFDVLVHTGPRGRSFMGAPVISDNGVSVETMAVPHGEVIRKELYAIRREVNRRLGIMDAYMNKLQIHQLSLDTLKTIKKIMDKNLSQQLSVLDYYGIKLKQKYGAYRHTIFKRKRPEMIARIKTLSK